MIQKKVRIRFTVFGVMNVTILNKWSDRGHNLKRGDIMTSVGAGSQAGRWGHAFGRETQEPDPVLFL